jgi:uncharacterized GH25 family protein
MRLSLFCVLACATLATRAPAHDTWVQTNTNLLRTGDAIHIDLMLGNHGNDHRDFKLASKLAAESIGALEVLAPENKRYDLKPDLVDLGYAPKEGFYSARFVPARAGLYTVAQTADQIVTHGVGPIRSYRSAKTYFVVSDSLDKVSGDLRGFDKPLGHRLELVPETNPVLPMGPGTNFKVRLFFEGKPLAGVKVSFIPRGVTLREGTDPDYERVTDATGRANFVPKMGTYYLIVAHVNRDEKGNGYGSARCTAVLTLFVPEKCPCCAE